MDYAVIKKGNKFVVYREDDPRASGGILFPPADGKTGYERARQFADSCTRDLAQVKRALKGEPQ